MFWKTVKYLALLKSRGPIDGEKKSVNDKIVEFIVEKSKEKETSPVSSK